MNHPALSRALWRAVLTQVLRTHRIHLVSYELDPCSFSHLNIPRSLTVSGFNANRSNRRSAELRDSLHVSSAEAVNSLQPAQYVWTDRSVCHQQV